MSPAPGTAFQYQIEVIKDANDFNVTVIKCQGRLVSENKEELRKVVQPLIQRGGRIALDFADVQYLDSSGLGAVVGLKVSAINRGLCVLELRNLTPRIKQLLSMSNLLQLLTGSSE